jgi:glycosyltransferase involved in cell wall biosynthesis
MGAPGVTVAVLTLNSARTLEVCMASLGRQSERPVEVLIVDDGSADDTIDIATRVADQHGLALRVVANGARNISRGRNIAIDACTTDLLAFLDSDAVADESWVAEIRRAFETRPAPSVVGGEVIAAHATPFAEALAVNDSLVRDLFAKGSLLVSGCNMAVNVALLDGARFAEDFVHAEDIEFVHRACAIHPWAVAPAAVVHHESRATPRGYFRQMYRYGVWKARYSRKTGDFRSVDWAPTAVLATSLVVAPFAPFALLALPALCLAEWVFVLGYRRPPARLAHRLLLGWMVKNAGWGLGIVVGALRPRTSAA